MTDGRCLDYITPDQEARSCVEVFAARDARGMKVMKIEGKLK